MEKINPVLIVASIIVLSSCATDRTSQPTDQPMKSTSTEYATIYYVNGKSSTQAEYEAYVENLNSEKIDYSHEKTKTGESTFYRMKDARGHLYQVSQIVENQRRTMSVNVLSK